MKNYYFFLMNYIQDFLLNFNNQIIFIIHFIITLFFLIVIINFKILIILFSL